jgi:TetR/AcrR family transcriptional regulator
MKSPDKPAKQATHVRQASLAQAALQLAAQHSPTDITTGDLALAVGITQGAVFRHFANKEAIWLAAIDWTTDTLMTRLQTAAEVPDPLAALQAVFMAHVDFVVTFPGVPRVIFQELQHAQDTALKARVRSLMQQYRALLAGLLQRAHDQRLLLPGTDLQAAAVLFIGSVQGLVIQSMLSGQVSVMVAQAPGVFTIYLRGLVADGRHAQPHTGPIAL